MHWLFDLFIAAIQLVIPWGSHHDDRSVVGKSPMDRQAVWIARGINEGSVPNGTKLRPFLDVFRRRLFDVVGCPFLCGVLSSGGSFSDGVF